MAVRPPPEPGLLATQWRHEPRNNQWLMDGFLSLMFPDSDHATFYPIRNNNIANTQQSGGTIHDFFSRFGTVEFHLKRRIAPVVSWVDGDKTLRCIGTAFVLSCTGYVATACHVLLDPWEYNYGDPKLDGNTLAFGPHLHMGLLMPLGQLYGPKLYNFLPFEHSRYWGTWQESPLFNKRAEFSSATDIAVAKIRAHPDGIAYQPLTLSTRPYRTGDQCMAIGYAEMQDIPFKTAPNGNIALAQFDSNLYVSIGTVAEVLADKIQTRRVRTPGPCFDFRARIPAKMSGSPIFDIEGRVVRGVVSASLSGDPPQAFGCMLGPVLGLPIRGDETLERLMANPIEGMPRINA
jgi:hypothetical protein